MPRVFAGIFIVTSIAALARPTFADDQNRYGTFNLLDHRSRYGTYWFPEPLGVDEVDVDNEVRIDWAHSEGSSRVGDEVRLEIEKAFNLLTVELELPYSHEALLLDPDEGGGHEREEGLGNFAIAARHPIFQYVSRDEFFDDTTGIALELALPTNTAISKNTELVPMIFNALRLGERFSLQTLLGYSMLFGPGEEGGEHVLEYAAVFGYSLEDIQLPGALQVTPLFELQGETALSGDESGHNILTGTVGMRVNFNSVGAWQPRIGVGYVFPIDQGARDEFDWGIITSLVFEY